MSKNKQSSVEWLEAIIHHCQRFGINVEQKDIEQAKAMHKREHIETYNQGYRDGEHDASNIPLSIGDISEYNNAENYYNENYGGNNEQ